MVDRQAHRRHYAVEQLPGELQVEIMKMLQQGKTYYQIQQFLADKGYKITVQSLSRYYHGRLRPELEKLKEEFRQRRLLIEELMAMLKDQPENADIQELIKQFLQLGILMNQTPLTETDPVRLLREERERKKLEVEKKRLEIEVKKLELLKKKAEQTAKQIEKKLKKASREGRSLSEDEIKRIKEEVYGIAEA